MSTAPTVFLNHREPDLLGQTIVVIGGSAGIGLETARRARAEGADVIVTGRSPERLEHVALDVNAAHTTAFDANDPAALERFVEDPPTPIDHVMVTAGRPQYGRAADMGYEQTRQALDEHLTLTLQVARNAAGKVRPEGTSVFMGGSGGRRAGVDLAIVSTVTVAMPALIANLALELAPVRVNLIAPSFGDTAPSGSILGEELDARRRKAAIVRALPRG